MSKSKNPLAKLKQYKTGTAAAMLRDLKRTQKDIRAQIALSASQAKTMSNAKEREALFADIEKRYKSLASGIDGHIKAMTGKVAQTAHKEAVDSLASARITRYDPERTERYYRMLHPSNDKSIAAVFTEKMTDTAITQLRSAVVDTLRVSMLNGLTANETQKALRDKWDGLAADGNNFRFVDRAGRAWENARYLQMLTQTTAQRVSNESNIDTFSENGIELGRISDDGDDDCDVCAAWEGRVIQIAGESKKYPSYEDAVAAGVFHPNCTHRVEPMDPLLDKDEIALQGKEGKLTPEDMADPETVQEQKDKIDEARHQATGMSPEDARRAVTADRLEKAILAGTASDGAAEAARMLGPAQLDAIRAAGIPKFEPARNGETVGTTKSGRVLTPRHASADDMLNLLGIDRSNLPPPPKEPPAAPPKPVKPKAPPPPFPDDPENLKVVRALGGSTGAELVEDAHGQQFVRKRGGSAGGNAAEHVRSEAAADDAYRALGVDVPSCKLYEQPGKGPVKLSKYIPDASPLGEYLRTATKADRKMVLDAIRKDFDIDVVFGNRDVIGMDRDNILVDKDGKPWRIDNGAAFGWRAQGARKNDFTKWPDELWSMRDAKINTGIFDTASIVDTAIQAAQRDWKAALAAVPQQDAALVRARLGEMQQLGTRAAGFKSTGYVEPYTEQVLVHSYALSKDGFRESVPKTVTFGDYGSFRSATRVATASSTGPGGMPADWKTIVENAAKTVNTHAVDSSSPTMPTIAKASALKPTLENLVKAGVAGADYWLDTIKGVEKASQKFGTTVPFTQNSINIVTPAQVAQQQAAGHASLTAHGFAYIDSVKGGDSTMISNWQGQQSGSSWSHGACWRKIVQEEARPLAGETFKPVGAAKTSYDVAAKAMKDPAFAERARVSFAAWDAVVQLALENTAIANSDPDTKEIILLRTESDAVKPTGNAKFSSRTLRTYKSGDGELVDFPKGACESHSTFKPFAYKGRNLTMVRVPFSSVKGMYFFESTPGSMSGCYAGESENEVTCDARGLQTMTIGKAGSGDKVPLTVYSDFSTLTGRR